MAFKIKKKENINFQTPQEMYSDYKNRTIPGLIDYQSEMIDNYINTAFDKSDVALELPTGSGKTLTGLVIGEFRRRKNKEKVVYLCPNKQLVNQVVEQANIKYGIKSHAFIGKQSDYDSIKVTEYLRGEVIAVTTYSAIFNSNPFFDDADILILDDAHSSENYISSNWTIEISKYGNQSTLFLSLVEYLKDKIGTSNYNRLTSSYIYPDDLYWCDLIPNINLIECVNEIESIIDSFIFNIDKTKEDRSDKNLKYTWPNLKGNLKACNFFIDSNSIVIKPYIPPTKTIKAFTNPKQRIYMSATLGNSGELERITGIDNIFRLPMVNSWDKKGLGRRFFIFPKASFKEDSISELLIEFTKIFDRGLLLTKNNKILEKYIGFYEKNTDCNIFLNKDIESSKKNFIESKNSIALLSNRYDGIDLSNDECRLLIIDSLSTVTNIQENFFATRMNTPILFNERIKTRIVQSVGRCNRNPVDYSVVCILSEEVTNQLSSNKNIDYHPELKAEVEFGYDQYEEYKTPKNIIENINIFLKHDYDWEEIDENIIQYRDEFISNPSDKLYSKIYPDLLSSSKYEVKFQYALWREDYAQAIIYIEKILNYLKSNHLKGYRGYWYYMYSYCNYLLYKQGNLSNKAIAEKYLNSAASCSDSVKWFKNLIPNNEYAITSDIEKNDYLLDILDNIEDQILKYGTRNNNKFEDKVSNIINLLNSSDGNKFEEGHNELGKFLGYTSINPPGDSSPDPYWIINENICVVSEDKIYEESTKKIPTNHVRQAGSHKLWIKENVKELNKTSEIITVFITNSDIIEKSALTFTEDIYYVNRTDLIDWGIKSIDALRKIRRIFTQKSDLVWRSEAMEIIRNNNLTPLDFLSFIKSKKLNQLKIE